MDLKKIFSLVLQIVTDFRIIIIFVCVILYLNFVIYVSRYRKSDRRPKGRVRRSAAAVMLPDENDEVTIPETDDED